MVTDALSKRYNFFTSPSVKILGFEHVQELYRDDQDFRTIYASCMVKKKRWMIIMCFMNFYLRKVSFVFLNAL